MDFDLTAEQRMVQETVRKFAANELEPVAAELDANRDFPWENIKKMAALGLMGILIPEDYGGAGLDSISYAIVIEELSRVCASTGVITSVTNSLAAYPIFLYGTEEQKNRYVIPLASGEMIGSFALTEPEAGSDAGAIATTAVLDGDCYRELIISLFSN